MSKKIFSLPDKDGQFSLFELVEFVSHDKYPETEGCYFLRPAKTNPDLTKMTKAQLIEYIEALNEDN